MYVAARLLECRKAQARCCLAVQCSARRPEFARDTEKLPVPLVSAFTYDAVPCLTLNISHATIGSTLVLAPDMYAAVPLVPTLPVTPALFQCKTVRGITRTSFSGQSIRDRHTARQYTIRNFGRIMLRKIGQLF